MLSVFAYGMGIACVLIAHCQSSLFAENPNQEEKSTVKWKELDHYVKYQMKMIRDDETVLGNRRFDWKEMNDGVVLLFCDHSGGLLRLFPSKSNFEVLVFPDPDIADRRFRVAQSNELNELGIDVDVLIRMIHPTTNPTGKSTSKFTLRARIESRIRSD